LRGIKPLEHTAFDKRREFVMILGSLANVGEKFIDWFRQYKIENYIQTGFVLLRVLFIILIAGIVYKVGKVIIKRFFEAQSRSRFHMDKRKIDTLSALSQSLLKYLVYFVAGLTILGQFMDTTSILATAGIGGLAIGFGAQSLVKDVISGFFILFEEQYAVGDYVSIGDTTGTVEEIGLRITKIRGFKGELTVIPNGQVIKVINYTRGNILAVVDVGVSYESDVDKAIQIMKEAALKYAKENSDIVEEPQVLGIMDLGDSNIVIRIVARTLPMKHWGVERELRKRIKEALDRNGIPVPYPPQIIVHEDGKEG
jgi:small conductance mechanosensitive channel